MRESTKAHNLLQPSVIILPRNCSSVPENWLILEILSFLKYGIRLGHGSGNDEYNNENDDRIKVEDMAFYGPSGNRQTIKQFVSEYEYTYSLVLYFRKPDFSKFHTSIFQMFKQNTES